MIITSPKDVLAAVAKDLKSKHLSQQQIAEKTGYQSRQAISHILKSEKYMSDAQAKAFCGAFGYYDGFLLRGEGSLWSERPDPSLEPEIKTVYPKMLYELPPFEDRNSFQEAFDSFLDGLILEFGAENIRKFIVQASRYIEFYLEPSEEDIERRARKLKDPDAAEKFRKEQVAYYNSTAHKAFAERMRSAAMERLFHLYYLMVDER